MNMNRTRKPVSVRAGRFEFLKVNAETWEWRDLYHWILALNWPRFAALIIGGYCVAGMARGSFPDAFFFSVQTLATVGYGHMYPQTLYGHVVAMIEIIAGMFWLAVITGLIFVRFSRPAARILFSKSMVIAPFNAQTALMLRIANLR